LIHPRSAELDISEDQVQFKAFGLAGRERLTFGNRRDP
jgi:hypothetical protein